MKILKFLAIGICGLVAILLLIAAFVPKQYTVSEKIVINKPKQVVYDYVKILKNQEQFSEWAKIDPPSLKYSGIDGTVGAMQTWDSQNKDAGAGSQKITALTPDRMDIDLEFIRPFKSSAKAANIFRAVNDSTTELTSEFYANDAWPMNLMGYFFAKGMIAETEKKNLQNAKGILEKLN